MDGLLIAALILSPFTLLPMIVVPLAVLGIGKSVTTGKCPSLVHVMSCYIYLRLLKYVINIHHRGLEHHFSLEL